MRRIKKTASRRYQKDVRRLRSYGGFFGFIIGIFLIVTFYQMYRIYAIVFGVITLLLFYIIYKYLRYNWDKDLFKQNSFEQLRQMDPFDFERLSGQIIKYFWYYNVRITQRSRDGWVDIWCNKGRRTYAIQCKRYAWNIGVKDVRALYGSAIPMGAYRIVMTTGTCSSDARKYALDNGIKIRDHDTFKNKFMKVLEQPPTFVERLWKNLI